MELFDCHIAALLRVNRRTDDSVALTLEIPESFPFVEGHFPDQPLLPASIALELSAWLARRFFLGGQEATILNVGRSKFMRHIRPMQKLQITLAASGGGAFRCRWLEPNGDLAIDLAFTLGGAE